MLSSLLSLPMILFMLLGISFILLTFMNLKKGLLIFLFLTPIIAMHISLYLSESIPLITFQRFGLTVLALTWIANYISSRKSKIENVPLLGLLSLFLLLTFIASVFSINPRISIREYFSERMIGSLLIYFLVFQSIRTERDIKKVINILFFSSFIVSLFGIFEFFLGENPLSKIELVPEEKLALLGFGYGRTRAGLFRIQSTFAHPICLSSYLVFLTPIILAFFLNSRKKLWLGMMLIVNFLGIAFTGSRGAWFVLGIVILLVMRRKKVVMRRKKALVLGLVIICILLGSFFYEKILPESSSMYKYRWWSLKGGLSTAIRNPIFGTGMRTFKEVVEVRTPLGISVTDPMLYLPSILVENGIFAFFVFLVIFGKLISRTNQASKNFQLIKDKAQSDLMLFSSVDIIAVLILGIGSITVISSSAGNIIFWAFAALLIRLCLISKKRLGEIKHKETNA